MSVKKMFFSLIVCVQLLSCNSDSAGANSSGPSDSEWQAVLARIDTLEATQMAQETVIDELEAALTDANAEIAALIAAQELTDTALTDRIVEVENTLTCASYDDIEGDFILEGCNVHIRDGSGVTETSTGLGNLIIGYDSDQTGTKDKTGSHNVVIGDEHHYSSFAGLVAGFDNTITAPWAVIAGGENNTVAQPNGSIAGGKDNTVAAGWGSIAGGIGNVASGLYSSVSGGQDNESFGNAGWVTDQLETRNGAVNINALTLDIDITTQAKIEAGIQLTLTGTAMTNVRGGLITLNNGGLPAARVSDVVNANAIVTGSPTVLIGQ